MRLSVVLDKLGLQDRLQAGLYIARNPLIISRPEDAGSGIEAKRISQPRATKESKQPPAR